MNFGLPRQPLKHTYHIRLQLLGIYTKDSQRAYDEHLVPLYIEIQIEKFDSSS